MAAEQKTLEERKAILAQQLLQAVAQGSRIESQTETMAVLAWDKPINHLLHFIIGIFTFGMWWIVWFVIAIKGGEKRQSVSVDEDGEVWYGRITR